MGRLQFARRRRNQVDPDAAGRAAALRLDHIAGRAELHVAARHDAVRRHRGYGEEARRHRPIDAGAGRGRDRADHGRVSRLGRRDVAVERGRDIVVSGVAGEADAGDGVDDAVLRHRHRAARPVGAIGEQRRKIAGRAPCERRAEDARARAGLAYAGVAKLGVGIRAAGKRNPAREDRACPRDRSCWPCRRSCRRPSRWRNRWRIRAACHGTGSRSSIDASSARPARRSRPSRPTKCPPAPTRPRGKRAGRALRAGPASYLNTTVQLTAVPAAVEPLAVVDAAIVIPVVAAMPGEGKAMPPVWPAGRATS